MDQEFGVSNLIDQEFGLKKVNNFFYRYFTNIVMFMMFFQFAFCRCVLNIMANNIYLIPASYILYNTLSTG